MADVALWLGPYMSIGSQKRQSGCNPPLTKGECFGLGAQLGGFENSPTMGLTHNNLKPKRPPQHKFQ